MSVVVEVGKLTCNEKLFYEKAFKALFGVIIVFTLMYTNLF